MIREEKKSIKRCLSSRAPEEASSCYCSVSPLPNYIIDSFYDHHIERWFEHFPRESFLFFSVSQLSSDAAGVLRRIEEFLGLEEFEYGDVLKKRLNVRGPDQKEDFMTDWRREDLRKLYGNLYGKVLNLTGIDLTEA
jgi:hypothetical protein